MKRRDFMNGILALGLGLAAGACVYEAPPPYGPPPYAPAHGYRYRHPYGVDLVFDSGLGVYVVVGLPNHFYVDGHFYRVYADHWYVSAYPKGPWRSRAMETLPPGLRKNAKKPKFRK